MDNVNPPGYITGGQAAEIAQVSERTIQRRVAAGELTAYRMGARKVVLYRESEIRDLLAPRPA